MVTFWQRLTSLVRGSLAPAREDVAIAKDLASAPPPPNPFDEQLDAREKAEGQI